MAQSAVPKIRRIALTTGGGDAPGLNAVIRAVTLAAHNRHWEVLGIRHGYESLIKGEPCTRLDPGAVRSIADLGGTIIGANSRLNPFETQAKHPRKRRMCLAAEIVVDELRRLKVDGLLAVGGDGSMSIALRLAKLGVKIVGIPKTIDNDLNGTERTFGFDTAVATATDCIDKLHCTSEAHCRVMVVEVMGRHAGWIALHAGIASSAHVILIPEIPYSLEPVFECLKQRRSCGLEHAIVVVSEGAQERGKGAIYQKKKEKGHEPLLGGAGQYVASRIQEATGIETRSLVLGHIQRGGSPTTYDRLLGLRYGAAAVRLAELGQWGSMVSFRPPLMVATPLETAAQGRRCIDVNSDTIMTARELGICLGD